MQKVRRNRLSRMSLSGEDEPPSGPAPHEHIIAPEQKMMVRSCSLVIPSPVYPLTESPTKKKSFRRSMTSVTVAVKIVYADADNLHPSIVAS